MLHNRYKGWWKRNNKWETELRRKWHTIWQYWQYRIINYNLHYRDPEWRLAFKNVIEIIVLAYLTFTSSLPRYDRHPVYSAVVTSGCSGTSQRGAGEYWARDRRAAGQRVGEVLCKVGCATLSWLTDPRPLPRPSHPFPAHCPATL